MGVEGCAHVVQGAGVGGEGLVELGPHAGALAALAGEHDGPSGGCGDAAGGGDQGGVVPAFGQGGERGSECGAVGGDDARAVLQVRPARPESGGHGTGVHLGMVVQEGAESVGGLGQGGGRTGRQQDGYRPPVRLFLLDGLGGGLRRRFFQDHVRVGAADAEGGHRGPARTAGLRPRP